MDGERIAKKVKRKNEADNELGIYPSAVGFHLVMLFRYSFF